MVTLYTIWTLYDFDTFPMCYQCLNHIIFGSHTMHLGPIWLTRWFYMAHYAGIKHAIRGIWLPREQKCNVLGMITVHGSSHKLLDLKSGHGISWMICSYSGSIVTTIILNNFAMFCSAPWAISILPFVPLIRPWIIWIIISIPNHNTRHRANHVHNAL